MECPHISDRSQKLSLTLLHMTPSDWECSVCKSKKALWMCLHCGLINCGRYEKGHAKAHSESKEQHCLTLDCINYAVFCYACDDFVINDTRSRFLHKLRIKFRKAMDPENCSNPTFKRGSGSLVTRSSKNKRGKNNGYGSCKLRISGLRNLGNTCFMNAVLQSLSNIQQFRFYFKQLPSLDDNGDNNITKYNGTKKTIGDKILLAEELRKTFSLLWEGSKNSISPEALFTVIWKVVPRFRGYQQQDAHEFLRYMLDRLHTELMGTLPYPGNNYNPGSTHNFYIGPHKKSTIVTSIFGGLLQNEVTCLVCGTNSKKHDPFLDLSLDIPQPFLNKIDNIKTEIEHRSTDKCHLFDCLSSFVELEELADTELYFCPNCKRKEKSTKKFWIRRLPHVLCLHLKRFKWSNYYRTKLDTYVEFPLKGLDMSKYILSNMYETRRSSSGSTLYDLAAVIVHHGSGAGSGHYTAYATHEGCWHHFNDSNVTLCENETVAQCKAYILFYIRRQASEPPSSFPL